MSTSYESTRLAMRALRLLIADILDSTTNEQALLEALAAARWFITSHCASCGDVLDESIRQSAPPGDLCGVCMLPNRPGAPARSSRRGASAIDDNDVPF